jgi:periplasmic copper chaperone A
MKIKSGFVAVAMTILVACSSTSGGTATIGKLTISDAWVRATTTMDHGTHDAAQSASMKMDGPNSAAYLTIENKGDADVLLSASVSSDVADAAELHQSKEENGMMMMNPMPAGIDVPANGKLEIKPASYHIMLVNVKQTLAPGQTIKLALKFKNNGAVSLDVPVRENK